MLYESLRNPVVGAQENDSKVVDCYQVNRLRYQVAKPRYDRKSKSTKMVKIDNHTRLVMVGGRLFAEKSTFTFGKLVLKWIHIPADFLYTELTNALHPGEPVPLDADDPNYPVTSMLTDFTCRVALVNYNNMTSTLEFGNYLAEYTHKSVLFFEYRVTKYRSYYKLANGRVTGGEYGKGIVVRMGKRQMEKVLQFLRRHLCEFK